MSTIPKSRRRQGSGGIRRVATGVWRVDLEISRDPITGRRRRISRQVRGTKADAEVALAQLKVADATGRVRRRATRARTIQAALDAYLDDVERGDVVLAKRTIVTSRSARNTMSDTVLADGRRFGDLSLDRVGWEEIEDLYRSMTVAGAGAAWIRRCATVLTNALDRAREHGIIDHNPAKDADRPKLVRTKPRSPSETELRAVLAMVVESDPELGDALYVMAGTGVRMGELLGLQWPEVDLAIAEVHRVYRHAVLAKVQPLDDRVVAVEAGRDDSTFQRLGALHYAGMSFIVDGAVNGRVSIKALTPSRASFLVTVLGLLINAAIQGGYLDPDLPAPGACGTERYRSYEGVPSYPARFG